MGTETELAGLLEDFDKRIHGVEQQVTSPAVMGGEFPGGIVIGGGAGSVFIDNTPPNQVDEVTVTVGAIYDNVYADVEWTPSATGTFAATYFVELAKGVNGIDGFLYVLTVGGTSTRFQFLEPATAYAVRVTPYSSVAAQGSASPWINFTTVADTTIPPAPTGVVVARGATTVVVKFTPLTVEQARDVANAHGLYEIEIDTDLSFTTLNKRSVRTTAFVVAFNDVLVENAWYARVRAVDSSGNVSVWSAVAGPSTAGGVVDSMIVAGLDAAKITFGTMSGDRITTNTLQADRITTSSISASWITITGGGLLWAGTGLGGATPTGTLLSAGGVALYKAGLVVVHLNAFTGDATFKGTISASTITGTTISGTTITGSTITGGTFRTASSGNRVELAAGSSDRISLYSATWSVPATLQLHENLWNGFTQPKLLITAPTSVGTFSPWIMFRSKEATGSGVSQGQLQINSEVDIFDDLHANTVSANVKAFRIPHPLHEGMDLVHASLEGPENGVFYRGRAKTAKKKVVVKLPDYFSALTDGFEGTVYVTPVDNPCMIAASDVVGGKFTVTSSEDCEFSWVVFSSRLALETEVETRVRLIES